MEWNGRRDSSEYLARTSDFVRDRWHSERLKTITRLPLIFRTDIAQIWNSPEYAHCTTVTFVLYTMLVRSRYFTQEDIRVRHTFFNASCIGICRFASKITGLMSILRHHICTSP